MGRLAALLALPLLGACAASVPSVPMGRFLAGDVDGIHAFYDEQLREGDPESGALFLNGVAQMELLRGQLESARRKFRVAGQVMGNWQTSGSEVFSAIVGSESSKTWKGDPHEKAMNAYYTGLLYWLRGEPDNARASFRSGLLADAESDEGDARVDFALLYWLAGRTSLLMGLRNDAEDHFMQARQARQFAVDKGAAGSRDPLLLREPEGGNLLCFVGMGVGPRKVAGGRHGSLALIERQRCLEAQAEFWLDGERVGVSELLADVDYQASTRGGEEMEGIREGKAVFKSATGTAGAVILGGAIGERDNSRRNTKLAVGLGLLALSLLTDPEADTRCWETLPKWVHVFRADVDPGVHDLELVFRSSSGGELPELTQTWTIEVPEEGEAVYLFRSLPGLDQLPEVES